MASMFPAILTFSYMGISFLLGLAALNLSPSRRPLLLSLLVTFALIAFRRLKTVSSTPESGQILGLFVLIWLSHISSVLCIEKYILSPGGDGKWQWVKAYKMLFNARWIQTPRPAPDVLHTVRKDKIESADQGTRSDFERQTKTQNIPSGETDQIKLDHLERYKMQNTTPKKAFQLSQRQKFLLRRALSLLIIYIACRIYYILLSPHPTLFKPLTYSDFSPQKEVFFRRLFTNTINRREIMIRAWTVFHFLFSNWAFITGAHDILAILFVGIFRVDELEEWPPLFGSIANAYTLKGFWGGFWHSIVYRAHTSWAKFFSQRVLNLRTTGMIGKIVVNFLVFLFSGLTHALVSSQLGHGCGVWEEVLWFCGNFLAMMTEGAVQQAVMLFSGKENGKGYVMIRKGVGFLWVFGFFFWSLPKSHYPRHYCGARR